MLKLARLRCHHIARAFNSSTTLAQSAILGSSWLCRPSREIRGADWLEDLADIPEDIRNLHVQYKIPGYIPRRRVELNGASPHQDGLAAEHVVGSVVRFS